MKSGWFILFLASLFSKSYCSIAINIGSQPQSLLKSALTSIAKRQIDNSLTKEPFIAYSKLNDGTLEMFGTAFGDEVANENIMFLQKVTSNFRIHSVIFKRFYFDEKALRIFDVFHEKLQNSVKSVTFERCYFPESFIFNSPLELNHVTKISFIQSFANEESLKEMFKIIKNAPVTSLTISEVFDYRQDEPIDTNVALKRFDYWLIKKRLLRINDLELNSFFPNIKFLALTDCSLDFAHFSLTSLKNLNSVDLNVSFNNFHLKKFFKSFPTTAKCIKAFNSYDYYNLGFIENAFAKRIIIDSLLPFKYDEINCAKALSVFSSVCFEMYYTNDKMSAIKKYVESNGGAINTVTDVGFNMIFDYQGVTNMITLLTYFPNLENIEVYFINSCDASISNDQIRQLFSALPVRKVKKLSIYFDQEKETTAFYCFIVELMKLCKKMSSLEFNYYQPNSFAIKIKEMVERENIQFSNLDTFSVKYMSDDTDTSDNLSIDLFYVAKYNVKNLTLNISLSEENVIQNLVGLDQFECFSVVNLSFCMQNISNFVSFVNKLFTKFPHVTNFTWEYNFYYLIPNRILQNMKKLKKVTLVDEFFDGDIVTFLLLLPNDLELLEIKCFSSRIEEIENVFYEKFPTATLIMNARCM